MKPKILIEIKGGCLYNLTTNSDIEVFLQDHDNGDPTETVPVDTVVTDGVFTELVKAPATP